MEMHNIGLRIIELIEYLGISPHEFAKRCGLSSGQIVSSTNTNGSNLSLNTLEKILAKYPVNSTWLMLGKGMMWGEDYFQQRFESIKASPKTPQSQINTLLEVFEMNARQFCKKTSVGTCTLSAIRNGERLEVSKAVRDKIQKKYPFIKNDWFYS